MTITMQRCCSALFLALTFSPQVEANCAANAKAFPMDMEGKQMKYASLFDIDYYVTTGGHHYKVITLSPTLSTYKSYHPTMAGKQIPQIVLYQCGTPKPDTSSVGVSDTNARFFEIPIKKATIAWSGPLPFFEMLSVTEAIYLMDMTYVSSPCAQLMEECSPGIHMSQYDANWKSTASRDSVVFTDSFGTAFSNTSMDVEFQLSVDPGILNRAEWIQYLAAFFNLETEATEIFGKIETDYNALKATASKLKGDSSTEWKGALPQVVWVNSQPETCADAATNCAGKEGWTQVNGGWCHCGAVYTISNAHYKRDIVQDAGGRLVTMPAQEPTGCSMATNTDGSQTLTCKAAGLAAFKTLMAQADAIVDESSIPNYDTNAHDFEGSFSVTAADLPALARNPPNIFRLDGSVSDERSGMVGSNWFEQMPAQPQQILADMMEVLWSTSFDSPCGMKFMRRAIRGKGQTQLGHDDCPMYDASGNHDCAGIHNFMHEIPQCLPTTTTTTTTVITTAAPSTEVSGVMFNGLSFAVLALLACMF